MTVSAGDAPSQIYPDLSPVIPELHPIEYDGPLGGHGGYEEVESSGTVAIPHKKSAQEAKT